VRVGTFTLKVFNDDGEASMSGRYDIIMAYFAEVRVQRLTEKVFPSPRVYRCSLGGTDGPNDTGSILSTIFGRKKTEGLSYIGEKGFFSNAF